MCIYLVQYRHLFTWSSREQQDLQILCSFRREMADFTCSLCDCSMIGQAGLREHCQGESHELRVLAQQLLGARAEVGSGLGDSEGDDGLEDMIYQAVIDSKEDLEKREIPSEQAGDLLEKEKTGDKKEDSEDEEKTSTNGEAGQNEVTSDQLTSVDFFTDGERFGHYAVHEQLINDRVRSLAYRRAILDHKELFQGRLVLDVGSGSGLFSMFAASAGADRVVGVEMSSIADRSREVVEENGLQDIVTIIRGRVEEVDLPQGMEKVDIIISEWMGSCLFQDTMLDSVLYARDRWLAPGGLMFPDMARLYVGGLASLGQREERFGFWEHVHGFTMASIGERSRREAAVEAVARGALATTPCLLKEVDLQVCTREDITVAAPFHLTVTRQEHVTALVTWFQVEFGHGRRKEVLDTGPQGPAGPTKDGSRQGPLSGSDRIHLKFSGSRSIQCHKNCKSLREGFKQKKRRKV